MRGRGGELFQAFRRHRTVISRAFRSFSGHRTHPKLFQKGRRGELFRSFSASSNGHLSSFSRALPVDERTISVANWLSTSARTVADMTFRPGTDISEAYFFGSGNPNSKHYCAVVTCCEPLHSSLHSLARVDCSAIHERFIEQRDNARSRCLRIWSRRKRRQTEASRAHENVANNTESHNLVLQTELSHWESLDT